MIFRDESVKSVFIIYKYLININLNNKLNEIKQNGQLIVNLLL